MASEVLDDLEALGKTLWSLDSQKNKEKPSKFLAFLQNGLVQKLKYMALLLKGLVTLCQKVTILLEVCLFSGELE